MGRRRRPGPGQWRVGKTLQLGRCSVAARIGRPRNAERSPGRTNGDGGAAGGRGPTNARRGNHGGLR
eukprot:11168509-Lingulodinium_polyedra.AAC.1